MWILREMPCGVSFFVLHIERTPVARPLIRFISEQEHNFIAIQMRVNRVHEGVHHRGCILLWTLFYVIEAGSSFPGKEKVCLLLLMEKQKNCRILLQ